MTTQFGHRYTKDELYFKRLLDKKIDLSPEKLAIHIYRLENRIIRRYGEGRFSEALKTLSHIQRVYTQIEIYYTADIGKNFTIFHGIGTVIGADVVIGDNVMIYQNVTIGSKGWSYEGRPRIGDGAIIYAGSKILGDIVIGDNCIIGANAVVLKSFPNNCVIGGLPARRLKANNPGTNARFFKEATGKAVI